MQQQQQQQQDAAAGGLKCDHRSIDCITHIHIPVLDRIHTFG
jgi:hypothetical protein